MLTGTPELYASTLTMRTHQDRDITYDFFAVVYGTLDFHKLLTHLDFFIWFLFSSARPVYSNSDTNKASTFVTFTAIITFYVYTFTRDTRAHAPAYLCRIYIRTPTLYTVPGGTAGQSEGRVEETIYLQMNLVRYIFARADGKVAQRI